MVTPLIDESQKFLIPVDPVNAGSVCVWDYDFPFSLMIAYLMKSSERDVFKYWKGGEGGGVGEFQCVRKFELDTVEGFAQLSVSNLKTFWITESRFR